MEYANTILSVHNLNVGYSNTIDRRTVYGPISLSISRGEIIAIVGRNGIGKSTLLRTLAGLQPPISGSIEVNGQPLLALHRKTRAKSISFVPSDSVMVPNLTVKEFVALGRFPFKSWNDSFTETDWNAVHMAISLVGINHLTEKDITEVSDGERHRSMIALALAQNTEIILLDEPTAFLDLPNKFEMVRLLAQLAHNEGKSIIYSTHDLQVAIHEADTIWMMLDSGLVSGAPEDLIISNQFDDLLHNTNVVFDSSLGVFKNKRITSREITLEGEGTQAEWTQRMLERIGFSAHQSNQYKLRVVCKTYNGSRLWEVFEHKNFVATATSLKELANLLKDIEVK